MSEADASSSDETLGATTGELDEATLRDPQLLARLRGSDRKPIRLRHYVLLERLGEGGMGVVFAAYDETLERKVALKLLRQTSNQAAQRRLIREAQAMARLSHPNVVQIYEIGEVEGLTFIVMEHVDGVTLARWRTQSPRTLAELLAVFVAAGRGLAAAHEQKLVHRDFKPDNVMISRDGRVRVMDFGIAREHGDADVDADPLPASSELKVELTATGALLGTPAYMAPEQFSGAMTDARSDQFSFCVALWEALYDQRPFAGRTLAELSVSVTAGELVTPPKSEVPSWLHELLVRGLAVEPERRHPSMTALLRALENDPTRRRRMWTIAALVSAAIVGSVVGLRVVDQRARDDAREACTTEAQAIESAWNDPRKAELQAIFSASGSRVASSSWTQVEQRMDAYAREWTQLRDDVCRSTFVEHAREHSSYESITACLDERRAIFTALVEAWQAADAQLVLHAPLAVANLPPLDSCSGDALLERVEPPPDQHGREQILHLRARLQRVTALRLAGNLGPAVDEATQVLAEAEQLGWTPLIAEARLELGEARGELGEYDLARSLVEQAFVDALAGGHDRVALEAASSATSLTGYFLVDFERGLYWGRVAEGLVARMGLSGTTREAMLLTALGHVHWARGDQQQALDAYARALEIHELTLGSEHPRVADALGNVGYIYKERGDYSRAADLFQRALEINERTLGPEHANVATSLRYIGEVHDERGEFEEAIAIYRRCEAIYERVYGPKHGALGSIANELGSVLDRAGHHREAVVQLLDAISINRVALGDNHPAVASALDNLAAARAALAQHDVALAASEEALRINEAAFGPDHPRVGASLGVLARVQLGLGQPDKALASATRALAIFEAASSSDPLELTITWLRIGDARRALGQLTEAREAHRRALELREQLPEDRHLGDSLTRELAEAQTWLRELE